VATKLSTTVGVKWLRNLITSGAAGANIASLTEGVRYLRATTGWTNTMTAYVARVIADGAVGYWRLDEAAGTNANDSSGLSADGTYTGGYTLNQAGVLPVSKATQFDGVDATDVEIPNHAALAAINGTQAITIEAWVKPTSLVGLGAFDIFFGFPGELGSYMALLNPSGFVNFAFELVIGGVQREASTGVAYAPLITTTRWHHVVGTYDGANQRLYVDGVIQSVNPQTGNLTIGAGGIRLGAWGAGTLAYPGYMQEAAIYPTALTAEQISNHYKVGIGTIPFVG
jgi:hypothetical protein